MNIVEILIIVIGVLVIVEILYKIHVNRRLHDIDGFYGVHQEDPEDPGKKVIGSFGNIDDTKQ